MTDERPVTAPETAERLVGHRTVQRILTTAWRSGKLAHGWLLTGSEGIGKATLAFRFARAILADALADAAPSLGLPGIEADDLLPSVDPDRPAARLIAAGAHPNLEIIRRTVNPKTGRLRTQIGVDDVRDAMKFLHATATDGGWRIVVVDPIDDMNESSNNALLKALEEPPKRCLFLLVNHVRGAVLPTIRSRCQVLNMAALSDDDVRSVLENCAPGLPAGAVDAVLPLADGSPGRALRLLATDAPSLDRQLDDILGAAVATGTAKALDLADQVSRANATDAFHTVAQLLARRLELFARGTASSESRAATARLWFDVAASFRRTEYLNLDRRHTVLRACLDAREIMAR